MARIPSIGELLDGHVVLDVECFDRLYCNVYVPGLQTSGGTVHFLIEHRGNPIASPALFRPMGEAFRRSVDTYAEERGIPVVRFRGGDRKIDVARPYLEERDSPGVALIGKAQETQWVTMGTDCRRDPSSGVPHFAFERRERRITVYYFYIRDAEWGPCFIKLAAYFPYPGKMWANGHEWAKRQLERRGIAYTPLANGFASCADPRALRRICQGLGPRKVQALFDRWMAEIPLPLTEADRAAGYGWELSMKQVEFSKTLVLDRPVRARAFFERSISQNIDLGRPSEVEVIFDRKIRRTTPGQFSTRVVTEGVDPRVSIHYRQSRAKIYLKEGIGIRLEAVANNPTDFGVKRRICHLGELGAKLRELNRRMLAHQRVASAPSMTTTLFERVALPDRRAGRRTVALRYGDPRAMALMAALTLCLHQVAGFTNRTLRPLVATLLGTAYSSAQMSYDLWRLRGNALIERIEGTHTYVLTPDGMRAAVFYTKTYRHVIDPLFAAADPRAGPHALPFFRSALKVLDDTVARHAREAGVAA